jgi:hypothetical protein
MQRTFFTRAAVGAAFSLAAIAATSATAEAQRLNFIARVNVQNAPNPAFLLLDFLEVTRSTRRASSRHARSAPSRRAPTIQLPFRPSIVSGTEGVIQDLTVSPDGVVGAPIAQFLTLGAYTFSLDGSVQAPAGPTPSAPSSSSTTASAARARSSRCAAPSPAALRRRGASVHGPLHRAVREPHLDAV